MTVGRQPLHSWPIGRFALIAYLLVLVIYTVRVGLPADRIDQTIWILIGIVAVKLGRPLREHLRAVLDWLPLLAALLLYDYTRGIANTLGMPVRVSELVDVERVVFFGSLPTVWLQERFYTAGDPQWWDVAAAGVYMTHFVLPWAVAAGFYMVSRGLWWRYIRMVLLLSYTGLLTYILLPAAPPWYAGHFGVIEEGVDRTISSGWSVIGLRFAGAWLEREQAAVNQVAALPSLHAAFALLVSVALWPVVRNRLLRVVLVMFPVSMGLTLVYSGEHYVIDVLLGWLYVAAIVFGLRLWDRRWARTSAVAADLAEQKAGPGEVGRPDQQLVVTGNPGHRAADSGAGQRLLKDSNVVRGEPTGDRRE
ncbi:MAG TPA: phosphatase PAP2 family protein [Jiangellaceae bacterium]|nr:phosphatase PAP2 family protein [Jiangellaceae bacterium]